MKASTLMHFNHIAAFPMRLWVDHNVSTASLADSSIDKGAYSWTTCSRTPAEHIAADSQQKGGAKLLDDLLLDFLSED
jgi:hypothetical protein